MEELKEATKSNNQLEDPNVSKASSCNSDTYKNMIQHVKGTLIIYLKKTPIVDLGNEMLLKIIFSIMAFTDQEIAELKEARENLPIYKIDTFKTKKLQKERE